MFIVLILVKVAILVCAIVVLIKQFQKAGVLHGIVGLLTCCVWTFIWGWMNAAKLRLRNLMSIWTLLLVIFIIMGILFGFKLGSMISGL